MNGVAEFIRELGYEPQATLATRPSLEVWRIRRGATDVVLKLWEGDTLQAAHAVRSHRLLPLLAGDHRRLVVPDYVADGCRPGLGRYVLMSFIAGRDYRDRWHYKKTQLAGGTALAPRDIDAVVDVLIDLSSIDATALVAQGLALHTPHKEARLFERRLAALESDGTVSSGFAAAARVLAFRWAGASIPSGAPLTVSNTDYRFLNFIEVDDRRTAVIDWDDARCSTFEIGHCVAYQWLFLWNRPDLQERLLAQAEAVFGLDEGLWPMIVIRSILQAYTCRAHPDLVALHIRQAEQALSRSNTPLRAPI